MTVEEQEKAATAYWQSLIQRDRTAKAADAQTAQQAQANVQRDDVKLQRDIRAQQGLAQG